jgi:hypothetical protein
MALCNTIRRQKHLNFVAEALLKRYGEPGTSVTPSDEGDGGGAEGEEVRRTVVFNPQIWEGFFRPQDCQHRNDCTQARTSVRNTLQPT